MKHLVNGIRFFPEETGGDGTDDGTGEAEEKGEEDETPTPEEIEALRKENAKYKAAEDKRRTAAAREAKAKQDAER